MELIQKHRHNSNQPDWVYFREITERWIRCLNGSGASGSAQNHQEATDGGGGDESSVPPEPLLTIKPPPPPETMLSNFKTARKIKYQSYHVARNIRKIATSKLRGSLRLRQLTEDEEKQVDAILKESSATIISRSGTKTKCSPAGAKSDYRLTNDEQSRCSELDGQLKKVRRDGSSISSIMNGPRVRFCFDEKVAQLNAEHLAENERIGPSFATIRANRIVDYVEETTMGI